MAAEVRPCEHVYADGHLCRRPSGWTRSDGTRRCTEHRGFAKPDPGVDPEGRLQHR